MGSHSVNCHPAEDILAFTSSQLNLVFDLATQEARMDARLI